MTDELLIRVLTRLLRVHDELGDNPDGYEHAIRVVGNRIPSFLSAHLDEIAALLDSQEPDDRTIRLLHAVAEIMRYSAPETMRNAFVNIAEGSLLSYLEWAFANGTTDDQAVAVYVAVSANKGAKVAASRGATHAAQAERYNDIIEGSRFDYEILEYLVVHIEAACHASTWIGWAIDSTDEDGLYHRVLQTMIHSPAIDVIEGRLKPHAVGEIWPRVQRSIPLSQYTPLRAQVVARMRSAAISAAGALALVKQMGTLTNKMRFSVDPSTADMALTQFLWHLANAEDEVAAAYLEANAHEVELTLKAASSDDVRNAYLEARTNKEGEKR